MAGGSAIIVNEVSKGVKSPRFVILVLVYTFVLLVGAYGFSAMSKESKIPEVDERIEQGPDFVVYAISGFIAFIGSIFAVAFSWDSIIREKISGSMNILLSKPISVEKIALSKFLGVSLTISLPITWINLSALYIIGYVCGRPPSTAMCLGFLIFTLIFVNIYVCIQMIFSTVARDMHSAVLMGIGMWMFFTFFWLLITIIGAYIAGIPIDYTNDEYTRLCNRLDILSPNGTYGSAISVCADIKGKDILLMGVPHYAPVVSISLWLIVSFIIYILIFKRCVRKGFS